MDSNLKPRQGGGINHVWQSPDGNFRHMLLRLDLDCDPDPYPGVVIVADGLCRQANAAPVENLQKELPKLLAPNQSKAIVYWWLEQNDQEREKILCGLTRHPVFVG